jgi:hypothetical protein
MKLPVDLGREALFFGKYTINPVSMVKTNLDFFSAWETWDTTDHLL